MSDVVQGSERHRWLGLLRYDLVGAAMLAANRSYRCRVAYLPPPEMPPALGVAKGEAQVACVAGCQVCRAASLSLSAATGRLLDEVSCAVENGELEASLLSSLSVSGGTGAWREVEGEFMSVMMINHQCRSEKTRSGMARFAHLADGKFSLVLVRACSPLQYLTFLTTMSASGDC